ncbi:MAG: ABC transporter ATP-binding protein [Epulopiscium sp.]|nr:ABC transporter ATP-binding protein [Candidatus Epulonipiscium sp.]
MARNKYDVDENLETEFNIKHLTRVMQYVKPYRKEMFITVFLMLVASVAMLLGPILMKQALDDKIPNGDILGLLLLSAIFLVTIIINGVSMRYRIRTMSYIGQNIVYKIREDLFVHLQSLPFTYYDSRPHGKILVRVVNYVNSLSDLLSNGLVNLVTDLFSLIVIIGFMFFIDVKLTVLCLLGLPFLGLAIFILRNAHRKSWQAISAKQSNLNAYIHESIEGMKVTQSFAREEKSLEIFEELGNEYRSTWMTGMRVRSLLWPIIDNISTFTAAFIYVVGVSRLHEGITVGVLIAFISYIGQFWGPIMNLSNFYNSIVTAMAYLERIFETMDEEPLVKNIEGAEDMPMIVGDVVFDHVSFEYEEGQKVLDDVSFHVEPGETIALVGPTGAGKTTIVNLLSRFYNVTEGQVRIDGHDIQKVTLESLRKQMGVMLQDTFIFSGTIMDNIRYGKLDATDEEVMEAAKAVKAHEFIMEMQKGYQTEVNERGTRLSVGQRQLISFARALLADPRILILDEATSSIDTKTEQAVQEGLERLLKGRTSFVIAHRLSTIKNATCIMVIDSQGISEKGTHDELLEQRGKYYQLYKAQNSFLEAI